MRGACITHAGRVHIACKFLVVKLHRKGMLATLRLVSECLETVYDSCSFLIRDRPTISYDAKFSGETSSLNNITISQSCCWNVKLFL